MRIKIIMLLLLLAGCQSTTLVTQNTPRESSDSEMSMEDFCQQNECRGKTSIMLRTDGDDFTREFPYFWPVIQSDAISILPGEKLFVEADLVDKKIVNLKHVRSNVNPARTFVLEFTQGESNIGMMLSLENPFNVPIKFNMEIMDFRGGLHQTSSCPVFPGASIYESWPHPIVQLYIANPRILSESGPFKCEY